MQKNLEPAYSIDVTCHRCGETWRLNPKMWRNFDTVKKNRKKTNSLPLLLLPHVLEQATNKRANGTKERVR